MKLKKLLFLITTLCLYFFVNGQVPIQESKYGLIVLDYLETQKSKYNFTSEDLSSLIVTNESYSKNSNITYVYLNQGYLNIPIYNAISTIAIKNNKVFHFSNRFINNLDQLEKNTSVSISPQLAISKFASEFNLGTVSNLNMIEDKESIKMFSKGNISGKEIPVRQVYFNDNGHLKIAWDITVYTKDSKHWWNVRIDAKSNVILDANDYILTCSFGESHNHNNSTFASKFYKKNSLAPSVFVDGSSYNVFALPTESPNHGPRSIVTNPASPEASPFGWHDDNGVDGAEYTITRGNNVLAQEDINGNNGVGFSPDGTSALNFNFDLNFNQPPVGSQNAAITNLFYLNNMMHDILYNHGFDEASGNFQANNYGNGGFANDFVFADAQDGSGLNNANFGTPPDGQNPVMQMFLWSGFPGERLIVDDGRSIINYLGVEAQFGASLTTTALEGDLIIVNDGIGSDTTDACDTIVNTVELDGNIAVIRRGNCEFGTKVLNAENAGAIGVIVINNNDGPPFSMVPGTDGVSVTIPSIMVSQADGEFIINRIQINPTPVKGSLVNDGTGPFNIDGDFDNVIIGHEYAHGISTRLTGGPSMAGCLSNDEQMGEGWSDWFGLMVTMSASDLPSDARGIGTYATNQDIDDQGIRPERYSPEFSVNSFTYISTNNEQALSIPHGVGFVWATMLWDLTWAYIEKYGFDSDLFNGDGGNNRVMKLVIEGLKLQPCSPGFIDGRDAILAADMAMTGGEDQCMIWEVFSRRGLGLNASQGLTTSRTDQAQDFSMPPDNDPSLANCTALTLSTNDILSNFVQIYPNPSSSILNISVSKSFGDVKMTLVDLNGRIVLQVSEELNSEARLNINVLQSGLYILNIKGDEIDYNTKIVKN